MAELKNHVRAHRLAKGWSQEQLAEKANISRAGVSAIENGTLVPSAAAALSLAAAFACRVEDLFSLDMSEPVQEAQWVWQPSRDVCRYWRATVNHRRLIYPAESWGSLAHDGVYTAGQYQELREVPEDRTLVVACCDPAAPLLAQIYAQNTPFRMMLLDRSSHAALTLLQQGLVHAAGVHLGRAGKRDPNIAAVRDVLGEQFNLIHVTDWDMGIALAPGLSIRNIHELRERKLTWIGRQKGSGARACQDEVLQDAPAPKHAAGNHHAVAEIIRSGFAQAGACLRSVALEAQLDFLPVRTETYDLCFVNETDPRISALITTLRSPAFRQLMGDLPGYSAARVGEIRYESSPRGGGVVAGSEV